MNPAPAVPAKNTSTAAAGEDTPWQATGYLRWRGNLLYSPPRKRVLGSIPRLPIGVYLFDSFGNRCYYRYYSVQVLNKFSFEQVQF